MKQSVIQYSKVEDDKIKIIGFEHVATSHKLKKVFGESVLVSYQKSFPYYNKLDQESVFIKKGKDDEDHIILKINQVIPKETFQEAVSMMKLSGNRLIKIQEKIDTNVYEVKI